MHASAFSEYGEPGVLSWQELPDPEPRPRGGSLLNHVDFAQLGDTILDRWEGFEDLPGDKDWVENYFKEMNRTRRRSRAYR